MNTGTHYATEIREYIKAFPHYTNEDIIDITGCSNRTVQRVRKALREENEGYEFKITRAPNATKPDMVNHPPHYTKGGIECIDYIQAKLTKEEFRGYLLGNSLKYLSRMGSKGSGKEDANKAAWYINKLAEAA